MIEKSLTTISALACGMVMPISAMDSYPSEHWKEVQDIIRESINSAGFEPNMVSDGDEVGIIQKRIIQNLYNNPIVVCDVSGKNPNVMFELGIRLAFDKPTIIIKDDITTYSFDTSPVEHLEYPRDLRYQKINEFKKKLTDKIINTCKKASEDSNYSTFLHEFGKFTVARIQEEEVSTEQYLLNSFEELRSEIKQLVRRQSQNTEKWNFSKLDTLDEHIVIDKTYRKMIERTDLELESRENRVLLAEIIKKDLLDNEIHVPISSIISYLEGKL